MKTVNEITLFKSLWMFLFMHCDRLGINSEWHCITLHIVIFISCKRILKQIMASSGLNDTSYSMCTRTYVSEHIQGISCNDDMKLSSFASVQNGKGTIFGLSFKRVKVLCNKKPLSYFLFDLLPIYFFVSHHLYMREIVVFTCCFRAA